MSVRFNLTFPLNSNKAQSAEVVEYTDCISAEVRHLLTTSVLDMTLNYLEPSLHRLHLCRGGRPYSQ